MENKEKVLAIIEEATPQIEARRQMDITYTQGVCDGWKQAFEYIKNKLAEEEATKKQK